MTPHTLTVRSVAATDFAAWSALYEGYRNFYRLAPDPLVVDRVWGWITDDSHEVTGLVAASGDDLLGLAHYRRFARPSTGTVGIYLDDLFTSPAARGQGVARSLLARVSAIAEGEGRSVVRWITARDNAGARKLYDSLATETAWVTYDLTPGSL